MFSLQVRKAGPRGARSFIGALVFWAAGTTTALAGDGGSALLDACSGSDANHVQSATITGVAMGLLLGQSLGGPKRAYCPPNSGRLSPGQYRSVACKFLAAHPQIARQEEYTAIGIALLETYPCAAEKK